jgi:predicted Ser/Thr protein kinase
MSSGPAAGEHVGERWRIEAPLSSGAMGAVYLARDTETDAPVALKRLIEARHAERFEIEARLLSRLRHPRVVEVLDHFSAGEDHWLVMELVDGSDLQDVLRDRGDPGLPAAEAVSHVLEACEALQYVHAQQIVHRDVKPANLILGNEGVVLVDFGIAREWTEGDEGTRAIGTPRYMAPEIFVGEAVSPRSDVYSLAATLWTLLTGAPPVYYDTESLTERVPGLPDELETALKAGLELHPEKRIASVEAFASALGANLDDTADLGRSLAISVPAPAADRALLEAIVRTAAGVFEAAAASVALTDAATGELVYQAAWGAGAEEIVGVRLAPGTGIAGAVVAAGEGESVPRCREDERFAAAIAAGTGYVPITMVVAPLQRDGATIGAISVLDRRDGGAYGPGDLERARLFADLTVTALDAA